MDDKSYEHNLIHDVSCKTLIGAKSLRIKFEKVDRCIRDYDRTKYLVLFGREKHNAILDRIRYLIVLNTGITYVDFHDYAKIKFDAEDDLPLKNTEDA